MARKTPANRSESDPKPKAARPRPASRRRTPPASAPLPPDVAARVRMYRQGLGDCFLVTFPGGPETDAAPCRVLVDCGVFQNTPGGDDRLRRVAEDVRDETGGVLDLLVVTHEHWDHVSGFARAADVFQTMTIRNVWLSWAENPNDPDADALKRELGKRRQTLVRAVAGARARLAANPSGEADAQRIADELAAAAGILEFFGPDASSPSPSEPVFGFAAAPPAPSDDPRRGNLGATMNRLRDLVRPGDFLSPGDARPVPGAAGVLARVLGPPRDPASIRKTQPSRGQAAEPRASLAAALDAWFPQDPDNAPATDGPFEPRHRVAPRDARSDPFFREHYGFPDDPLGDAGEPWRGIDDAWLGSIAGLALQLDVGVNNTSLALAFELPDRRTLIFPGDAQIGNWLSWDRVAFPDGTRAPDLLARAVLYKVGHHGSHNATLGPGGLRAMTSGDLVALVPTDEAFAKTKRPPATGWRMPDPALAAALEQATRGRVLRADHDPESLDRAAEDAGIAHAPHWRRFRTRVRFGGRFEDGSPLHVECDVPR